MTSEALRSDQRNAQVDKQQESDDSADEVGDHKRSSPRNVSARTAKPPISSKA
jgi:hypothetical protein